MTKKSTLSCAATFWAAIVSKHSVSSRLLGQSSGQQQQQQQQEQQFDPFNVFEYQKYPPEKCVLEHFACNESYGEEAYYHLAHGRKPSRAVEIYLHHLVVAHNIQVLPFSYEDSNTHNDNAMTVSSECNQGDCTGSVCESKHTNTTATLHTKKHTCGPDITDWLVAEMNSNINHRAIKTNRDNSWAMWIPGFNKGWHRAFLSDFNDNLTGEGKTWDYTQTQDFTTNTETSIQACSGTVTLCGHCFSSDIAGKIMYGWVGRAARIRSWFIHHNKAAPYNTNVDANIHNIGNDFASVDIGIEMFDGINSSTLLCPTVLARKHSLAMFDCSLSDATHPVDGKLKALPDEDDEQ